MSIQTGAVLYQFIADRLDEKMRQDYPDGQETYRKGWRAAHELQQAHAQAVSAGDDRGAERHLHALRTWAAVWISHPDHPAPLS